MTAPRVARPRVVFAGRARYRLPLVPAQRAKWDAVSNELDPIVLASSGGGAGGDSRFRLLRSFGSNAIDGPLFYTTLPVRIAVELRRSPSPVAIVCQSPYETAAALLARAVVRAPAAVIAEVHGDWRTATRLYGSSFRRLAARPADALAVWALRRADGVRTLSGFTSELVRAVGVEPDATFPTWTDLDAFVRLGVVPLPVEPRAVFIGVLQPYKNIEGVVATWRRVLDRVPAAVLHVVGDGPQAVLVERLRAECPANVEWSPALSAPDVAAALDRAQLLFLPSRREGLGRVVIEALARARPVVAANAGGIPDLVQSGVNGELFDPDDHLGMANALAGLFEDRERLEALAAAARPSVEEWLWTPGDYADRLRNLIDVVVTKRR